MSGLTLRGPVLRSRRRSRWPLHAAVLGTVAALALGAKAAGASELDDLAAEAGVDPTDLAGAVNTTGMEPRAYLCAVGHLPCWEVVFDTGVQTLEDGTAISAIQVRRVFTPADTHAAIARAPASLRGWVHAIVRCETGGTFNPYARGRLGERGAVQLYQRGLLPHFFRVGYTDPDNPYQATEYLWRALRGEWARQGVGAWHWSCAR
jgi:hypothetical protein